LWGLEDFNSLEFRSLELTTTTKIFVILVCLSAFIFTPMAIQFAAFSNDWRTLAKDYRDTAELYMAAQRNAYATMVSQNALFKSQRDEAYDLLEKVQQQLAKMEQERDALIHEIAELKRSESSLQAATERLSAEMTVINTLNQELLDGKDELTRSEQELRSRSHQLSDRVKELSTEIVVLKQQLYQAQEVAEFHNKENEQLRKEHHLPPRGDFPTAGPEAQAKAETPAAWAEIRGEVVDVKGNSATISVGSTSGLKPDMTMVVVRDNEYICDLVVTNEITPNEAVATIQLTGGKRIRPGDAIIDEHSFNSR